MTATQHRLLAALRMALDVVPPDETTLVPPIDSVVPIAVPALRIYGSGRPPHQALGSGKLFSSGTSAGSPFQKRF
jgi:hypothetical protein